MLFDCLKCINNRVGKNPEVVRTKNGRIMLLSKYVLCNSKKSKFIKEQEAKGLLDNLLGVKILILGVIRLIKALF